MRSLRTASLAASLTLLIASLGACSANGGRSVSVDNPSTPASKKTLPPTVKLSIKPTSLLVGQTATVTWITSNATSCTAVGAWGGTIPTESGVPVTIGPVTTPGVYTYGANCVGPGGSGTATVIVTVGEVAAPTIQFAITPDTIVPGGSALITWSTTNANGCTGSSGNGASDWEGAQPTQDSAGFNTKAVSTVGQYAYNLTCLGPGGSTQVTGILTVDPAAVAAAPTVTFAATPSVVQPGQATSFSWTTTGATVCSASGGSGADAWQGAQPVNSSGTSSGAIAAAGSYSYTLTCTGAGGSTAQSVDVVVNAAYTAPPVTVDMSISPAQIVAGNSAALTWSTANASACTASGSWSGSEPLLGAGVSTGTLTTPGVYSYTLSCTGVGGGGSQIDTLTVTAAPAVISQFAASPATVTAGGATTLSWSTAEATSCTASGGSTGDAWTGAEPTGSTGTPITPSSTPGTYIYTLSCTGPGGVGMPQSASVTVVSPTPSAASVSNFTATPATIQVGQAAMLAWSTNNATSCAASNGAGSWAGTVATSSSGTSTGNLGTAGSYIYTLTCTGPGGTGSADSVVVNVTPAPSPAPTITSFVVQPNPIQVGQGASLSWATTGASGCTATGGTGSDGWNGPMPVSSTGTSTGNIGAANSYTYTLTCAGTGGNSAPSSVSLNVTAAPQPAASITSFTASPSSLQTGGTTQLAWTTTGASSCTGTGGSTGDGWAAAQNTSNAGFTTATLNTAGQFVYTLTCTGSGGTSSPQSVTVDVTSAPPAAAITSFAASPTALASGGYATFTWASSSATSCAGTGGTGSDGWTSISSASSTGTSIGPINQTGAVNYTLTCTGPGGTGTPSTVAINVTPTAPAASVSNFSATPSTVQNGQSVSLAWTSSNATSCIGSGGTASWAVAQSLQSTGTSSGAISAVGTYVFTLICTGPGGASAPATATVSAIAAPPAASIGAFPATPNSIQAGQSTSLAWTSANATSCAASGGDNADGWNGSTEPVVSTGTTIGPINTAGTYVYTLTCSGVGGTSPPSSINVTVNSLPPTPSIASFTATPSTVTAGGSTSLAWSSNNASTCTPGGGTGSDGWTGAQAPSSTGVTVGPLSSGPVTYTLTCTGSGGTSPASSATVTVNPVTPAPPTVALSISGSGTIQTNASATLTWTSTNATSCVASGGATGDGWAGARLTSSTGTSVGPLPSAGTYTYTLTCSGAGGSGSSSVQVTVAQPSGYDCGIPGLTTEALVTPAVTVTSAADFLCVGCTTFNSSNLIDATEGNYATIFIPVGVGGTETVTVNGSTVYPAGSTIGFVVANSSGLINLSLLGGLAVQTSLGGNVQETAIAGGLLQLQAAGLLGVDQYAGFVGFTTTKPFDSVALGAGALLSLGATWHVYSTCVSH
jgi:hypothetical protein